VPLWNPYLFGGLPYVAGMHGDIFYPTALLRLVLPTDVAMTWGLIIHLSLAGLFTFVFLRTAGLGFFGALAGGLAYMLGGNVAGLVSPGHDGKMFVSALLPLALLFVHRGVRDSRPWAWGALALTITLAVLTPHPQLLQYLLLVAGAYALFLAFSRSQTDDRLQRGLAVRRLGLATLAVAVGLLAGCAWMGRTTVGTVPSAADVATIREGASVADVVERLGVPVEYWSQPDGLLLIWRARRYDFDHVDLDPSLGLPLASLDPTIGTVLANFKLTLERGTLREDCLAVLFDRAGHVVAVAHRDRDGRRLR
jgi:hypothetical protein